MHENLDSHLSQAINKFNIDKIKVEPDDQVLVASYDLTGDGVAEIVQSESNEIDQSESNDIDQSDNQPSTSGLSHLARYPDTSDEEREPVKKRKRSSLNQ